MSVKIENDEAVRIITIDRPECRNAIAPETAQALHDAFQEFDADSSSAVAVLTGAGGHFCAGFDLKRVDPDEERDPNAAGPLGPTRMLLSKPVIAAVEGFAVAGGLELALWCDMRIASETAVFGVFCRRWGVPLIDGGTVRLPRIVGQGRALDMILTGRPVEAIEALDIGLANRVTPAGSALAEAVALARSLAKLPQVCLRGDRLSTYQQWDYELVDALKNEGRLGLAALEHEASLGAGKFVEGAGRGGRAYVSRES